MISVKDLHKSFGGVTVLDGISTDIEKGDVVCIIGPSGSGKSTFLRCLNRLETPDSGQILLDGVDLTDPAADLNRQRMKMGMVFQQFNLFPHMTVLKNLTLAPMLLNKGCPRQTAEARAMALLERVGLADRAGRVPLPASPAARSSALPSSGPCAWSRRCCCLTSPPPPWTRRWWGRCWT